MLLITERHVKKRVGSVPFRWAQCVYYEDISRSSPCPSHALFRHLNSQMSSSNESLHRSIKKDGGLEKQSNAVVSKKVLNVQRNSVTPPVKVRI